MSIARCKNYGISVSRRRTYTHCTGTHYVHFLQIVENSIYKMYRLIKILYVNSLHVWIYIIVVVCKIRFIVFIVLE